MTSLRSSPRESPEHTPPKGGRRVPSASLPGKAAKALVSVEGLDDNAMRREMAVTPVGGSPLSSAFRPHAELEAERLWWSESSARQVKELEDTFGAAYQKTTEKLRTEMHAFQERLETMLEAERKQRHSALLDVQHNVDAQQVTLMELSRHQHDMRGLESRLEARLLDDVRSLDSSVSAAETQQQVQDVHGMLAKLRSDLDMSQTQQVAKNASIMSEWAEQKAQMSAMEAAVTDLRREFAGAHEQQTMQSAQLEELHRELQFLREAMNFHSQGVEETRQLVSCYQTSEVDAKVQQLHQELRSIRETTDKHSHGVGELHRELSTIREVTNSHSLGVEEVTRRLSGGLETAVLQAQVQELRNDVEASKRNVHLQDALRQEMEEDRRASQQCVELLQAMDERYDRLAQRQNEERDMRTLEVNVLKARIDVALQHAQPENSTCASSSEDATWARREELDCLHQVVEATRSGVAALLEGKTADEASSDGATKRLEELVAARLAEERVVRVRELAELRLRIEAAQNNALKADAASVRDSPCSSNQDRQLQPSAGASNPGPGDHTSARDVSRLEATLQKVELQVKRLDVSWLAVGPRLDGMEAAAQQVPLLLARMDDTESELKSLLAECGPVVSEVGHLWSEFAQLRAQLLVPSPPIAVHSRPEGLAGTPSEAGSTATSNLSRATPTAAAMAQTVPSSAAAMAQIVPSSEVRVPQRQRNLNGSIGTQRHSGHTTALTARTSDTDPMSMTMPAVRRASAGGSLCTRPPAQSRGRAPQQQPEAMDYLSSSTNEAAVARAAASLPVFTEDLKDNVGRLVEKVNHTVSHAPVSLLSQAVEHQAADALAATVSKDNYMRALMAVQDLRERNLSLREENAGLVAELLTQDQEVGQHSYHQDRLCATVGSVAGEGAPYHQDRLCATVGSIAGEGARRQPAAHCPPVANNAQWAQAQQPQFDLVHTVPSSRARQEASPMRATQRMASPVSIAAQRMASPVSIAAHRAASPSREIPAGGSIGGFSVAGNSMTAAVSYPGGWQRQLPATAASLSSHVQSLNPRPQ